MQKTIIRIIRVAIIALTIHSVSAQQNDSITKITSDHLSEWQDNKFGMFIHWGLYSIPAGIWNGEKIPFYSEQIMNHARIPVSEYELLAKQFNPTKWNADEVVKLAKAAGMKYIVFTSKHHDGFCMFKTSTTSYNVVDATPYGKDIVGELAKACKKHGLKLGLYYSLPDWHYAGGIPRLLQDSSTNCTEYVNQVYSPLENVTPELEDCIVKQLSELLTNYGEIETIWFDMGLVNERQSIRFRNTVKNIQPACLISGRIMNNQGDYLTLPDNGAVAGYSNVMWDNPASMYGTWGYRSWQKRPPIDKQTNIQLKRLMNTVSNGGVFLLNIGPTGDGKIIDYEKEVLKNIGKWVNSNSEAIYKTDISPFEKLSNANCTKKDNKLYISVFDSVSSIKCMNLISDIEKSYILDNKKINITTKKISQGTEIEMPQIETPFTVVLEFANPNITIEPEYILPNEKGNFELTEHNSIIHAAFDAKGYLTTQAKSWKSWNIDLTDNGEYEIFAIYTPEYAEKQYTFSCENISIKQVLPGVDNMMQTCYVGKMNLKKGKTIFKLESTTLCNPLEALGLEIHKIELRKKQ